MKYYILGDNNEGIAPLILNGFDEIIVIEKNAIQDYLVYLKELQPNIDKYDVLIMNAEFLLPNEDNRLKNNGIELLKWIRIDLKILNRIFILGFRTIEFLIQSNPKDYILFAPGNYYLQLPFHKEEFTTLQINSKVIKSEQALKTSYNSYLKADFDIAEFGHSFANKFGLYIMAYIHKKIQNPNYICTDIAPKDRLVFTKALFLYDVNVNNDAELKSFDFENKRILYIDDQANDGWEKLLKDIFITDTNKNRIQSYEPNGDNYISEIVNITSNFTPDVVLLDLRLFGNAEEHTPIKEVSGYKVLIAVKKKFPSLPVIMFSATNKAENLNELIKAKAFGLWTKPRIENELDICKKYNDLIEIVDEALNIFETELDKTLFQTDYILEEILVKKEAIITLFGGLLETDTNLRSIFYANKIILDSNAFRQTKGISAIKYQVMVAILLIIAENKKKQVIIIEDIERELALGARKNISESHTLEQKNICKYSLNKIDDYKKKFNNILNNEFFLIDKEFEKLTYSVIENNRKSEIWSNHSRIVDVAISSENANEIKINKENNGHKSLHADDVFKFLILHYLKDNKKVLFVNDDSGCKQEVVNILGIFYKDSDTKYNIYSDYEKMVQGYTTSGKRSCSYNSCSILSNKIYSILNMDIPE